MGIFVSGRSNGHIVGFLGDTEQSGGSFTYHAYSGITQSLKHIDHIVGIAIDIESQREIPLAIGDGHFLFANFSMLM